MAGAKPAAPAYGEEMILGVPGKKENKLAQIAEG